MIILIKHVQNLKLFYDGNSLNISLFVMLCNIFCALRHTFFEYVIVELILDALISVIAPGGYQRPCG